jgi:hypothetical protein
MELTGLIAFQNLSSKFNGALDVPAQGFCQPGGQITRQFELLSTGLTNGWVCGS